MSRKNNIGRTINYLFKDSSKLEKEGQKPIVVRKNLRTRKLENIIKEFEENEANRTRKRKDAVKLYHTILSFHEKDTSHLNEKVLKGIVKEYMQKRGENIYLATVHFDRKSHVHIHCIESGNGYRTSKANRISKEAFRELKVHMETFQKERYPELTSSRVTHGKKQQKSKKVPDNNSRETNKKSLLDLLSRAEQKAKSIDAFLSALKQAGHEPYYRNGKLTGIKYDGETKFRFSRLGYDKEKLEALQKQPEEQIQEQADITRLQSQLEELSALRSRSGSSREHEAEGRGRIMEEENEPEESIDMEHDNDDYSR